MLSTFTKVVCCLAFFAVVSVQCIEYHQLQHDHHHQQHHEEHGPVHYEFKYDVHDPHTGDIKSQKEIRKDDKVEGVYELIDSDGHRRIVQYKADDHNGFTALVHREPTDIKIPQPEPHHHHKEAPLVHYSKYGGLH